MQVSEVSVWWGRVQEAERSAGRRDRKQNALQKLASSQAPPSTVPLKGFASSQQEAALRTKSVMPKPFGVTPSYPNHTELHSDVTGN